VYKADEMNARDKRGWSVRRLLTLLASLCLSALWAGVAQAGPADPVNLALGKWTRQSSLLPGSAATSNLAVDGNSDPNYWDGSVMHTDIEDHAWWEVDLGSVRQIGRIEIVNRGDCCADRLVPFMVIVSDIPIIDSDITDADADAYPGIMRTRVSAPPRDGYRVPINRSGRWVRIALLDRNYLHLAEVKVFEAPDLARGRYVWQSSTAQDGAASRAVDGDVDGTFESGSVSATNVETRPFWQVDLGMVQPVREVHVWNQTTCCSTADPRPDFVVWVSENEIDVDPVVTFAPGVFGYSIAGATAGSPVVVTVNRPARYVKIESMGTDSMSLAEVQVFRGGHGAEGGHARASSVVTGSEPDLAIDGNFDRSSGATTSNQSEPYWEVDLGSNRYLDTVGVWSRAGTPASLAAYNLFVSDNDFVDAGGHRVITVAGTRALPGVSSWVVRGALDGGVAAPASTTTAVMRRGRYVRVMLDGTNTLNLAEVDIGVTEAYVSGLFDGAVQGPYDSITRTFVNYGYVTQPSATVWALATDGLGGDVWLGSTIASATPQMAGFSGDSAYSWYLPFTIPDASWPSGGVGNVRFFTWEGPALGQTDDTPRPLRSLNVLASDDSMYWPDTRQVSTVRTPDDNDVKPPYLDSPAGTSSAIDYLGAMNVTPNIDPTLFDFNDHWIRGNQDTFPTDSVDVAYFYDRRDLGIGRSVHCSKGTAHLWPHFTDENGNLLLHDFLACLVTNYSPVEADGTPVFGDEAGSQAAFLAGRPGSTDVFVNAGGTAFVGAYDSSDEHLTPWTPFDGTGHNQRVPNNCMSCHAGSASFVYYPSVTEYLWNFRPNFSPPPTPQYPSQPMVQLAQLIGPEVLISGGPNLLPFDPTTYGYIDQPGLSQADLAESFRKVNSMIRTSATFQSQDVIEGSYGGPDATSTPGAVFNPDYVPALWAATPLQKSIYQDVIKPYCRTCHLSQFAALGGVDFQRPVDADAIRALIVADVCVTHRMPHGQQAMRRFWSSGARSTILGYFGREDFQGLCAP
jgi:F5/8 type C domain